MARSKLSVPSNIEEAWERDAQARNRVYVALRLTDAALQFLRVCPGAGEMLANFMQPFVTLDDRPPAEEVFRDSSKAEVEEYRRNLPDEERERTFIWAASANTKWGVCVTR